MSGKSKFVSVKEIIKNIPLSKFRGGNNFELNRVSQITDIISGHKDFTWLFQFKNKTKNIVYC